MAPLKLKLTAHGKNLPLIDTVFTPLKLKQIVYGKNQRK